ncbi:hypothetical protein GF314_11180 [bacterium]|nr:hypothetical protein [bacterium]
MSTPRRLVSSLLLPSLVALLLVGGCGNEPDGRSEGDRDAGTPVAGGTAVIAIASEPDVLNPITRTSAIAGMVLDLLSTGLAELRPDMTWEPRLAHGWEVADDGLAITYTLRPWRWEDGRPLTARDLVRSFELIRDARVASPRRDLLANVADAEALDPATVRYRFAQPVPDPVQATAHVIVPAHRIEAVDVARPGTWPMNRRPLASGPFRIADWESGMQLVLERNPEYARAPARLDRVILRILPDRTARILALETGDVDLVADVPIPAARRLADHPDLVWHEISGRVFGFVMWNVRREALADPRVRRAFSLAIDRERFVTDLLGGFGSPAASYLPPVSWNHHDGLAPDPFRPDSARALLRAAGWRDDDGDGVRERNGRPLALEIIHGGGDGLREDGASILRQNLAAVGAAVTTRALERATAQDFLRQGRFDAYWGEFQANMYGDPSALVRSGAGDRFNFGGYANARVDSLLDRALAIADRDAARPFWYALQEELARDQPAAVIYYLRQLVATNRRLRGATPDLLSPLNGLERWWIAPEDRRWANPDGY